MMNEGKLFVLRHGEAEHNGKFFAGNRFNTSLTERGRADAEIVAEKLSELADCDVIYCSYLDRSRQTAEIVSSKIQQLKGTTIPVVELAGIEEVDGGSFSGLPKDKIQEQFSAEAKTFYDDVVKDRNIKAIDFPGGENYEKVVNRLSTAIAQIREELEQGKHIAIITHANTINVLLDWLEADTTAHVETHVMKMEELDPAGQTTARGISDYYINVVSWSNEDSQQGK
jgi:broad specificity phosphatase PhoE